MLLQLEKKIYFISHHYKFIGNDKIGEGTLINTVNGSLDAFDYHLKKRIKDFSKR